MFLAVALAGIGLVGCEHGRKKRLLERIQPPQPLLAGTAAFSGGVLSVESWLGPTVRLKKIDDKPDAGEGWDSRERRRLESESSERGERTYQVGSANPFEQGSGEYSPQEVDEMYGRKNYEFILPPRIALTFKFTNTGTQPVTFTIAEVNSLLGNFAPRPETQTVAPGKAGTVDPMLSTMESNFEELDVSVTVKIGARRETQILKLRRVAGTAATPQPN